MIRRWGGFSWVVLPMCLEMKLGFLIKEQKGLDTDLKRNNDFTGSLKRISMTMSLGRKEQNIVSGPNWSEFMIVIRKNKEKFEF